MANPIGYTTAAEVERLRAGKTAVFQGEATAEGVPVFLEERARTAYDAIGSGVKGLQARVGAWTLECFGDEIACDMLERMDRFTEEALELVQSLGYTPDRAHALVDYVFGREAGEPSQEVGGTMTTLAALCNVAKIDIETAFRTEVDRITTPAMVQKIRAKQAAKPTGSALPVALSTPTASGAGPVGEAVADEGWQPIETAPTGGKFGCFLMLAFGPPGDQTVSEGMHFQGRFYAASVFYTGGPHDTKQFTFREHEVKPTHWRHTLAAPGAARPVEEPGEVERQRGWIYFNPDAGTEWAENHPVESGEVPDAEDIRPGIAEELLKQLIPAWRELATETSRRETAEAALAETRERLENAAQDERNRLLDAAYSSGIRGFLRRQGAVPLQARAARAALTGDAQEGGK